MKTAVNVLGPVVLGLAIMISISSCAATGKASSGFLGDYARNLQPGPEGGARERWLKPGVDFSKYNKLIIEHVIFFLDDDSYKGIDSTELSQLAGEFDLAIVDALKGSYPIVTEAGPDVLRIRIAITNLKQSKPARGVLSVINPVGMGLNLIKKGTTGTWTGSGATSAEFLGFDSMTDQVVFAGRDERSAGFTERYTKWGSAEEAFKFWAERIRKALDEAHGVKEKTK